MAGIFVAVVVQAVAAESPRPDFERAQHRSVVTGRPLVVLVGADWCPACQVMKKSILPQIAEAGGLQRMVFVYVDFDRRRRLASRLTRGKPIPQLIRFDRTPAGWTSRCLIGAQSVRQVGEFIGATGDHKKRVDPIAAGAHGEVGSGHAARESLLPKPPALRDSTGDGPTGRGEEPRRVPDAAALKKQRIYSHWMTMVHRFSERASRRSDGDGPNPPARAAHPEGSRAMADRRGPSATGHSWPDGPTNTRSPRSAADTRRRRSTADLHVPCWPSYIRPVQDTTDIESSGGATEVQPLRSGSDFGLPLRARDVASPSERASGVAQTPPNAAGLTSLPRSDAELAHPARVPAHVAPARRDGRDLSRPLSELAAEP